MMYLPIELGVIIGVCTKCATTSILDEYHVRNLKPITAIAASELKKSGWKVIGIVRDPIDRLESAYNYFQRGQQGFFPDLKKYVSIDHFIDSVLNGDTDKHWETQAGQLLLCDTFVDLETFPLSRHVNSVKHQEKIEYKMTELLNYYMADTVLRGGTWQEQ